MTPRSARRTARRSVTSATTVSTSRSFERVEARGRAHGHADVVAAGHERARDVRADEPGRARDEGGGIAALRLRHYAPAPMARVAVVTDTTHYMPRALVEELGLHEVSLYVTFEGETQREADIVDLDDFYARLSASSEMPGTSQPSVGDFLAVYEPLLGRRRRHRLDPPVGAASPAPSRPPGRRATSSSSAASRRSGSSCSTPRPPARGSG